jgi:hypothetical protein
MFGMDFGPLGNRSDLGSSGSGAPIWYSWYPWAPIPLATRPSLHIRPTDSLSNPESYTIWFNDPKLTCWCSVSQDQSNPMQQQLLANMCQFWHNKV